MIPISSSMIETSLSVLIVMRFCHLQFQRDGKGLYLIVEEGSEVDEEVLQLW